MQRRARSQLSVRRLGQPPALLRDLYARLMRARWRYLLALLTVAYLVINLVFAGLFLLAGECIEGSRPGSFADAFSFSIQTLSTIGYGHLTPQGTCGDTLVAIEALVGIIGVAVATGLVYSKFARPVSGVLFSNCCVIHNRDGVPHLMFRLANARGTEIVGASIAVTVLLTEITKEGDRMRRLHDLKLLRSTSPVFMLSWSVMHAIDESSPLYGLSHSHIVDDDMRIIVNFSGKDGALMQEVFDYWMYLSDNILFDKKFKDVVIQRSQTEFDLDLGQFHQVDDA